MEPGEPGPAGTVAEYLHRAEAVVAYPGLWLRPDVYATHGHYLDCHMTVPRLERLLAALMQAAIGGLPEQRAAPGATTRRCWRRSMRLPTATPRPVRQRGWALGRGAAATDQGDLALVGRTAATPRTWVAAGAIAYRRPGDGQPGRAAPFRADLIARRGSSGRGCGRWQRWSRLGSEADYVIFGHTHRAGPRGEEPGGRSPTGSASSTPAAGSTRRGFGDAADASPYWPGSAILVGDEGPPRLERLLMDLHHEDFAPMLDSSPRAPWPDSRDPESQPPP